MATIVEMINPLTGLPEQVDQLDHTAQEIDDAADLTPQLSNPNILDNWYFGNSVNQRGQTEYAVAGYTIDRWKASSTSVVLNVSNRKLTFNAQYHHFRQYIENPKNYAGKTVTVSILGKVTGSIILQLRADDNTFAQKYMSSTDAIELWSVSGKVPDTVSSNLQIVIMSNTANSSIEDFLAAKLELGSQQTLAHQENGVWVLNEIPNYGEQLARCQRYAKVYGSIPPNLGQPFFCAGFYRVDSGFVQLTMVCPEFREIPVVSILDGDWTLFDGENVYTIGEINVTAYMPGVITLGITSPGNSFSNGKILTLFANSGKLMLSADL